MRGSSILVFILLIVFIAVAGFALYFGNLFKISERGLPEIFVEENETVFEAESKFSVELPNISYPLLFPNPRWNHMPIKVFLDESTGESLKSFGEDDLENVREAFLVWEEKTEGIISFEETESLEDAEIFVSWFSDLGKITRGKVVGEGGPTKPFDTGLFTLIEEGEIFLIPTDNKCIGTNRAVHELGHTLGLSHAPPGFGDIMYSKEISCKQNITEVTINAIKELYKIPPNPDLVLTNVSATQKGSLLNFSFVVKNIGLLDSPIVSVDLLIDGKKIDSYKIPRISPGFAIIQQVSNLRIPRTFSQIDFVADLENTVQEISEENNKVSLSAS